ncbi:response regulator transcription factor [Jannaschia sp. CCS1]|uniref:response regulator transcription factor n=1 Tax=Jannaschia sp. (strain CCS1) TaxID=290400 RepID=UPI000053B5CE|nr:helix-turn-helix transcriptional regulator [Jannaschia sp. CCS1]ABD56259.1 transcriptional regulator, LuxR family [Jannaschia sp. CCS1]
MAGARAHPGAITELAAHLLAADGFDERAVILDRALGALGGDWINIAEGSGDTMIPHWFYSTLPADTLTAYASDAHWRRDTIYRTAMQSTPQVIWSQTGPRPGSGAGEDATFDTFIGDAGTKAIVTYTLQSTPVGDTRAISLISSLPTKEVFQPANLRDIADTIRLMLPWMDASATRETGRLVPYPVRQLSQREREAVTLLAGGLQTARISDAMGVAEVTVHKHIRNARHKLGARTREHLVAAAIRRRHIAV